MRFSSSAWSYLFISFTTFIYSYNSRERERERLQQLLATFYSSTCGTWNAHKIT